MKPKIIAMIVALGALTPPALAEELADTNGDGWLTLDEVQAAWPEISSDRFIGMDSDGDGLLDEEELDAARDAGELPDAG